MKNNPDWNRYGRTIWKLFDKLHGEERVIIINGNQEPQAVAEDIWMVVQEYVTVRAAGRV